jgi:hypothetical protein
MLGLVNAKSRPRALLLREVSKLNVLRTEPVQFLAIIRVKIPRPWQYAQSVVRQVVCMRRNDPVR